jgi:hypothetical protein
MSDDESTGDDEASEELGKSGEKMGGIANRFGASTDTTDTSGTLETSGTTDTSETPEMSETEDENDETPEESVEMTETSETTNTTESSETPETSETTDTIDTSDTSETLGPGDEGFVLREDWNGRTIYLPDDVVAELDVRYSEVNVEWQRVHGEQLPKNERFYPALVRAALNETSIEKELGVKD